MNTIRVTLKHESLYEKTEARHPKPKTQIRDPHNTVHREPEPLDTKGLTPNPEPYTLHPGPENLGPNSLAQISPSAHVNSSPWTPGPSPETMNRDPATRTPKP